MSSSTPNLAAVFRNDLGPADVGRRVSVRYRLSPDQHDGSVTAPSLTDVVGVLHAWHGDQIVVQRRTGERAHVHRHAIVAAKIVPPDSSVAAVERVAALGWPARDRETQWPWLLRAHAGVTQRANSCLALDPVAENEVRARQQDVISWYRARELPPLVQVVDPSPAMDQFVGSGWTPGPDVLVMTRSLRVEPMSEVSNPNAIRIEASDGSTPDWISVCRESGTDQEQDFVALVNGVSPVAFFVAYSENHKPIGIARASEARGWAGLTDVVVRRKSRRGGVGSALTRAAVAWSMSVGAKNMYLQVLADNDAAVGMYSGLGFEPHHRYVYLQPPESR